MEAITEANPESGPEFVDLTRQSVAKIEDLIAREPSEVNFDKILNGNGGWMEKLLSTSIEALGKIGEGDYEERGFIESWWANTTFVSLEDVFVTAKSTIEDRIKNRFKRNSQRRTGDAFSTVFQPINKAWSDEFDLQRESAEKENVSKMESAIANKDPWQVNDRIRKTSDPDVLKACLLTLANMGSIRWRSPHI